MFCRNCGNKLKEEAKFCRSCGTDSTVMPIDDSKKTEEELSRNKELLLRHLMGDLNPNEKKVVAELLRSNDWARDFLNEAAENAHAPRADIPDSTKKILQQQEEIKEKRAKILGLSLIPKSTVKKISQESKENSEIDSDQPQKEEVIDTASLEEQDESRTLELTGKEVKPSHVENTDEVKDGEESVEVVSAEPKDPKCICNHCDQHISFDESMVGAEVTCPGCGNGTVLYIPEIEITEKIGDKFKKESKRKRINDAKEKIVTYINKLNLRKTAAYAAAVIVVFLILFYLTKQPNLYDMDIVEELHIMKQNSVAQEIINEEAEEDLQFRGERYDPVIYPRNSQIPYKPLTDNKPLTAREAHRFYWDIVEDLHNMKQNSTDSFEGFEERATLERLTKNEMIKKLKKETSAFVLNQYMELHVLIQNQTNHRLSRLALLFYCLNASWNEGAAGDYLLVKRNLPKSQEDAYFRIKGFNKFLKGSTLLGIKRTAGYEVSANKAKAYAKKYPNLQFNWKNNYIIFLSEFPWTFKEELAEISKTMSETGR